MSRQTPSRPSARRPFLVAFALVLIAPLLSVGPAVGHNATRNDGNDSPGRLDIRSASVGHKNTSVVHTVRTYEGWTPRSLGNDSFLIVEIDTNLDNDFERCAFIFFAGGRLRGSLTNCGRTFIRQLPVSKPSAAVARVTIPTANTGRVYRWVAFSYWTGRPARCSDLCFDAAPNRPPPILHDLKPPVVQMTQATLRVWEVSTTPSFPFPFTVSDADSGMGSWKVLRAPEGAGSLTIVASGNGGGAKSPTIIGVPGQQRWFHVEARDRQGNRRIGPERQVLVPLDDDELGTAGVFSAGAVPGTIDSDAWGGTYTTLAQGESLTYTYVDSGGGCREFALIGPGSGDWFVDVNEGGSVGGIQAVDFDDTQRQTLYETQLCTDITITITVVSGSGFGVDAILA
jgi:hypothetical protein